MKKYVYHDPRTMERIKKLNIRSLTISSFFILYRFLQIRFRNNQATNAITNVLNTTVIPRGNKMLDNRCGDSFVEIDPSLLNDVLESDVAVDVVESLSSVLRSDSETVSDFGAVLVLFALIAPLFDFIDDGDDLRRVS